MNDWAYWVGRVLDVVLVLGALATLLLALVWVLR